MSLADFESLTPAEFEAVVRHNARSAEQAERSRWERTRTQVVAALSPYIKGKVEPRKVLPLPWDGESAAASHRTAEPALSREALRERYRAAARAAGL